MQLLCDQGDRDPTQSNTPRASLSRLCAEEHKASKWKAPVRWYDHYFFLVHFALWKDISLEFLCVLPV